MKKVLFILLMCLSASAFGQSREWNEEFSITTGKSDSVFWPNATGDIAGYYWTATVETEDLSAPITIDFGGSNNPIGTSRMYFSFVGFSDVDSLPYTFDPDNLQVITNNDTSIQRDFKGIDRWGFKRPAFSLTTSTDTVFTLKIYMTFSK